jgi:SAM-dependent methyltransferase
VQTATSADGRSFQCTVDTFDAERDPYPYPDGHFDAVLCTELFEHLGNDPMHCLVEINRILKPGGCLLLSTPNVCSIRAIAAILTGYHPGFFPAFIRPNPGGEVDPRHHREYAPREIHQALEDAGFAVQTLHTGAYWSAPTPEHAWVDHLLEHYELQREQRGECIFALGRKTDAPRNRFPSWLYYG